ncbi:type III-B CRISPR-associated protein Cas10/Cmr2, partial [Synechococcus sp. R55.7]|uniref:type III-B CRISPR-associated protein Cas10/Cmr2 n=1 Tax=Synechococcus sp. R55.7 TaxID=2964500 RepID=UPI0039C42F6F
MSYYWQAKLWGLLHDPALKALHDRTGRSKEGLWTRLAAMQGWSSPKAEGSSPIGDADLIASASDRAAIGHLPVAIDYQVEDRNLGLGLEMSHLLSGRKRFWQLADDQHQALKNACSRADYLMEREENAIPDWVRQETDPQKVFWWFWRCFPQAICQEFGDESLLLLPAETRLPDGSLWSHASVTAALAGCLAGYEEPTRPFLVSFTFNPIQELIKASRKMRDFWAGSWLLHYLSARMSWRLAEKYGPDCLLYPSLYGQPLIDYWLREKYPEFEEWIPQPSPNALLTAGFPNVLLLLLPEERVEAAMQFAQQTLKEEWKQLAQRVLDHLQGDRRWLRQLHPEDPTWQGWLEHQWQHYWAAVPLGSPAHSLKDTGILRPPHVSIDADPWVSAQNRTYHLGAKQKLFADEELEFLRASFWDPQRQQRRQYKAGLNVGSWWAAAVEQSRRLQAACKQARDWQLPVAFGPRSTVSGLGPVVHPSPRQGWITEGESRRLWQRQAGLFDGREQLNATETLKRGLYKVLPELFPELDEDQIAASYPDLTAGVAGYLKTQGRREREHFEQAC